MQLFFRGFMDKFGVVIAVCVNYPKIKLIPYKISTGDEKKCLQREISSF